MGDTRGAKASFRRFHRVYLADAHSTSPRGGGGGEEAWHADERRRLSGEIKSREKILGKNIQKICNNHVWLLLCLLLGLIQRPALQHAQLAAQGNKQGNSEQEFEGKGTQEELLKKNNRPMNYYQFCSNDTEIINYGAPVGRSLAPTVRLLAESPRGPHLKKQSLFRFTISRNRNRSATRYHAVPCKREHTHASRNMCRSVTGVRQLSR